jgi:SAM-dependent methyltransferase
MSRWGALYEKVYGAVCGRHPHLRLWHFQWLSGHLLYSRLKPALKTVQGNVLDVGCGLTPYKNWIGDGVAHGNVSYTGLDTTPESRADIVVIEDDKTWPLDAGRFDAVLCTQVIEHAKNTSFVIQEILRVLKPGGALILTAPFAFNVHGAPKDYRRFSAFGIEALLEGKFEISILETQGAIGSTLGTFGLNWIETESNRHLFTAGLKILLFPLWLLFCMAVNLIAVLIDRIDSTDAFFQNVFVVAKKS